MSKDKLFYHTGGSKPKVDYIEINKDFVMVYLEAILDILNVPSGCPRDLLFWCAREMPVGEGTIALNKVARDKFIKDVEGKYGDESVKKAIKALVDSNALLKLQRGVYAVNPQWFHKGGTKKRLENIKRWKLVVDIDEKGDRKVRSMGMRFGSDVFENLDEGDEPTFVDTDTGEVF